MLKPYLILIVAVISIDAESITGITIGTSFRSCVGYCWKSVHINATHIHTHQRSLSNSSSYPELHHEYSNPEYEFLPLVELVGHIQMWKTVDSPIGCPDCHNEGAKWVDVHTDTQPKYGVKFSYNYTIPGYETLVDRLDVIYQRYFSSSH